MALLLQRVYTKVKIDSNITVVYTNIYTQVLICNNSRLLSSSNPLTIKSEFTSPYDVTIL